MSSTKNQPISSKRTFSEFQPEFPGLPSSPSFVAAQEFAKLSQKALVSVGVPIFPQQKSGFLPLISPHKLQQRFNVKEKSVFVVCRKSYSVLKGLVEEFKYEDYSGIYVRGPVGVGKSYLLYTLAADFRMDRDKYRVTYINNCAAWRTDQFGYILSEFVTTFYDDVIEGKSIEEWSKACEDAPAIEKNNIIMKMMKALINAISIKNIIWIVICDQHNALYNPPVVKDFPFTLINYFSDQGGANIKVIVSASANNEGYPTEMTGWYTHDISSHRFDDDEFKVWCDHYHLEHDKAVAPESEEAADALFWTGGVPYELDLLWKQPRESLIEKTKQYRKDRVKDMRSSYGKFCDKLSEEKKGNLKDCISHMVLKMSPPEGIEGIDRQLFDIIHVKDGNEMITALNPVARRALLGYHGQGLMTPLSFVAAIVLKGADYPNAIKGKISVMYITTMLELSHLFTFQFRKVANIAKIGLPDDATGKKVLKSRMWCIFRQTSYPHRHPSTRTSQPCLFPILRIILDLISFYGIQNVKC